VLIPSIDLMGGKIVQLVQGEKKVLEFDDLSAWVTRFASYPIVQLIDLDAAMGSGSNRELIADFCRQLPCQVGGGIRTIESAQETLKKGAKRVIVSSSLVRDGQVNVEFASALADSIGSNRIVCAIDSRGGRVAIHGWKTVTEIRPEGMIAALEPYCSAFLYTHIDTEGLLQGIPLDVVRKLRALTSRQFIAAGGIRSREEIDALDAMGADAVVGMAIYSWLITV
jgi:phosphoribosylformimino-5-aminoimidazole carboxamide ribotide isomerase